MKKEELMKNNLRTNEERPKNDVEINCSRDSVAIQLLFLFFLSILDLWTFLPLSQPLFTLIYSKTKHLESSQHAQASCYFILKQPCLHKRAGYLTMKLFGGLGESEASLGFPGVRKSVKITLLPSLLSVFRILF